MIKQIQNSIGLLYSYYQFNSLIEPTTRFTKSFSNSRTGIVILPFNDEEFKASTNILENFQKTFQKKSITLISDRTDLKNQNWFNYIKINKNDITIFNLIKVRNFTNIMHQKFDFIIDLNKSFVLQSSYFTRCLHSDLKISFNKKHGDLFYNFQFNSSDNLPLETQYNNLYQIIRMF